MERSHASPVGVAGRRVSLHHERALDGIRGFAVLAVLLYHGNMSFARGGFLGVDMFFVLSGFLITGLLLQEHESYRGIDLLRFWGRRARRLLPALFLVLLAVSAYSATLLNGSERRSLRLDSLSTLGYVANWRFAFGHQSYFAQYDAPSPLRHMWSLGIEEQFYIVFPIMVAAWLAFARGRTRALSWALLAAALGSALLMRVLYHPQADPSRVYYGTDTRAQALLLGAFVACWAHGRKHQPAGPKTYLEVFGRHLRLPGWGALGLLGLLVIVAMTVRVGDRSPWLYRGGLLVEAAATAAVIAGATRAPSSVVARLFSTRWLCWTGVISYGLYLWHWPVYVVLTPERVGLDGVALLVVRMGVTFALAAVSFTLIERPIRHGDVLARLRILRPAGATLAAAGVVAIVVLASTTAAPAVQQPTAAAVVQPAPGAARVAVVGDSVAYNLASQYGDVAGPRLDVRDYTSLGCGLIAVANVVDGQVGSSNQTCARFEARWPVNLRRFRPDVVVLMVGIAEQFDREVGGATLKFGTDAYAQWLAGQLDRDRAAIGSDRPVVLLTVPCHHVLSALGDAGHVINDDTRIRWLNDVQRRYADAHAADGVRLLDLNRFLCAGGYSSTLQNVTLRTDGLHYTQQGVQLIWDWLTPQLLKIAAEVHR